MSNPSHTDVFTIVLFSPYSQLFSIWLYMGYQKTSMGDFSHEPNIHNRWDGWFQLQHKNVPRLSTFFRRMCMLPAIRKCVAEIAGIVQDYASGVTALAAAGGMFTASWAAFSAFFFFFLAALRDADTAKSALISSSSMAYSVLYES